MVRMKKVLSFAIEYDAESQEFGDVLRMAFSFIFVGPLPNIPQIASHRAR